jgi:tetratricopeptide (TPR) repeat protein
MLRDAIQLSNMSTKNITAARQSCRIWNELLNDDDSSGFQRTHPPNVVALSLALYASCLVRTGQDAQAVTVYEKAFALDPTQQDLRLSQAYALQRLLRYADAERIFRSLESEVGWVSAATCALRLGDLSLAHSSIVDIVQSSTASQGSGTSPSLSLQGMVGTLQYLKSGVLDESNNLLGSASRSPREDDRMMYRWIDVVLAAQRGDELINNYDINHPTRINDPLVALLKLNLCAFDDPSLVLLDDKVHLHRILSKYGERTKAFWPSGTILSKASMTTVDIKEMFNQGDDSDSLYFLKERSGYGSHGNRILSRAQVDEMIMEWQQQEHQQPVMGSTKDDREKLLQTMVQSPLLILGRKFSLRIYVIFFSTCEVYISSSGLVKLASLEFEQDDSTSTSTRLTLDPRVHVTNSGSGLDMEQYDLQYFRSYLKTLDQSFDVFWEKLETAVRVVIDCYDQERPKLGWDFNRESLGIPKILGFDFVVDQDVQPWLVEVNRFPGMEPRDDSDRSVKTTVIHDTWARASERLAISPFHDLLHSLRPIQGRNSALSSLGRVVPW